MRAFFFPPRSKHLLISWLQSPSAVIWEPKKIRSVTFSTVSPSICHVVMGADAMIFDFWMLSFNPVFSLSSFSFINKLISSFSLSAIRVVSSAYLRLLIFLLEILIPACVSSSPAFYMMYTEYKLNKQGDNIQPWCTLFPVWNHSIVPCLVLTISSWPAYGFFRSRLVVHLFKNSPQFLVIYTVKGFSIVNEGVFFFFLESHFFFDDPMDVGNLISGSSALSKSNLSIWNFSIYVLLKPNLYDFVHYLAIMWHHCNYMVVLVFFGIAFLWDWNKNWPFPVLWQRWKVNIMFVNAVHKLYPDS